MKAHLQARHLVSVTLAVTAFAPVADAMPQWLRVHRREAEAQVYTSGPLEYSVYSAPSAYGGYTYPGYGPQPTMSSSASSTSENSPVQSSESSCKEVFDLLEMLTRLTNFLSRI